MLDQQGFFVFDSHQWLAQSRHERALATRERSSNDAGQQDANVAQIWVSEPLDVFWLYVLLVISASLLWLERKLDFIG